MNIRDLKSGDLIVCARRSSLWYPTKNRYYHGEVVHKGDIAIVVSYNVQHSDSSSADMYSITVIWNGTVCRTHVSSDAAAIAWTTIDGEAIEILLLYKQRPVGDNSKVNCLACARH